MIFLENILGLVLAVVMIGGVALCILAYFLSFAMQALKYAAIFIVIVIIVGVLGLFDSIMTDNKKENSYQYEEDEVVNEIDSLLNNFLTSYEANDIGATAQYLKANTTIEKEHLDYMAYQERKGITLSLQSYEITDVTALSSNKIEVITVEHFIVDHPDNGTQSISQEIRYTIHIDNSGVLIEDLEVLQQY